MQPQISAYTGTGLGYWLFSIHNRSEIKIIAFPSTQLDCWTCTMRWCSVLLWHYSCYSNHAGDTQPISNFLGTASRQLHDDPLCQHIVEVMVFFETQCSSVSKLSYSLTVNCGIVCVSRTVDLPSSAWLPTSNIVVTMVTRHGEGEVEGSLCSAYLAGFTHPHTAHGHRHDKIHMARWQTHRHCPTLIIW